jgi:LysM repeat protein
LPPTLAPLGVETDLVPGAATPIPTVIAVPLTSEQTAELQAQVGDSVGEEVTAAGALEVAGSAAVTREDVEAASSEVAEEFVAPAEEDVVAQEAIVVDATSDDLPIGGPVAANPPASETSGSYDAPAYGSSTYIIQPGDTLFSIAQRYGTTVDEIVYANGLSNDFIQAGQVLNIPAGGSAVPQYDQTPYQEPVEQPFGQDSFGPVPGSDYYVVGPGETLYRIALQHGTSVDAIAGANGIPYPYIIQSGQQLFIPAPGAYSGPPPPPPAAGFNEQPAQGYAPQAPGNEYYPPQAPGNEYYAPQAPGNDYYAPEDNGYYANPDSTGTHTVGPGETLFSIALNYGTSSEALASANGLVNPNQIYVGQVLYLP